MDNPETLATLGTQDTGQRLEKTKGTIKNGQPNWQHWAHKTGLEKTKGTIKNDNPEYWQQVHKSQDKG